MTRTYLPNPPLEVVEIDMSDLSEACTGTPDATDFEFGGLDEFQMRAEMAHLRERNLARHNRQGHRGW